MQETNTKISPYFDDFDSSKNYQKVLFKPGYSVQTRELNTLQSILQNQIERFGQHIFKDGSLVIPGNVNYDLLAKAVLIQPIVNGFSVESTLSSLKGKVLTGATSGVKAEVTNTLTSTLSEKDTNTLYVAYNYGGIEEEGVQIKEFKNNEVLLDSSGNAVAVTAVQNATAYSGSTATINSGVYFVRGFFVEVLTQQIILEQYSIRPSYKVGLQIIEKVVTSEEDSKLYDNSTNASNFASPGADRLQFELKLVKQNLLISENSNFIELLRFEDGNITQQADALQSAYSELERNLARRSYSNHGSFTTRPYQIKIKEALNNGTNGGIYNLNDVTIEGKIIVNEIPAGAVVSAVGEYGDGVSTYIIGKDYFVIELSEGKASVEGFEVLNEKKQYRIVPKPRKTQSINNEGSILQIGSYVNVSDASGTVNFNDELKLSDVDGVQIGISKALGLNGSNKLYVTDVSVFDKLTLSSVAGIAVGDFLTGSISGATGFVHDIGGSVVRLKQVSGSFNSNELIKSSNFSLPSTTTITSISKGVLENVRTFSKTSGFSCTVKLDSVSLSGSSFTVSGTGLTGVNTSFGFEIFPQSKIKLGNETPVEVSSVTSSTVTLSTAVTSGTYYSASKQICKLHTSKNGLTNRISLKPIESSEDYIHSRLITENTTAGSGGQVTIQVESGNVINKDNIIVTNSSGKVTGAVTTQVDTNIVTLTSTGLTSGESITVYYTEQIGNPTIRTKTRKNYNFLEVSKAKSASNNVYGTRYTDKEISLKFSDVIKVHAIHQSINDNSSSTELFDSLLLNDATNINIGDIIKKGNIRARIVSKNSNLVYVVYLSGTKFQPGSNLTISVDVVSSNSVSGIFIRTSTYGKYINVKDDFKVVRNDTNNFYRISKLVRKNSAAEPNKKLVVVFDYFEHSNTQNDFYSKESYGSVSYEDIPQAFNFVSMADMIDFRYTVSASSGSAIGTISSPFSETATNSPFNIYEASFGSSQKIPSAENIFISDYNFYTGRVDKVYLTIAGEKYGYNSGALRVIQGSDSLEPGLSDDESAGLLIATIHLPPYLKDVTQAEVKMEKTRNYTMKDIGKLEDRIINLEEYTSLSLLEVNTNNLNILDEEGKNRFKNGFVVDGFVSTDVADLNNEDYSASIDLNKNLVRPYPSVTGIGLYFADSESTAVLSKTYVSIPFEEVPLVEQNYSSRVENLFPYEVFSWIGNMDIFPKKDIWYDTQREVIESQSIDLTTPFTDLFDLVVPSGQIWDGWTTDTTRVSGGTLITSTNNGTEFDVNSLNFEIESGDTIQNIRDLRYARSRVITTGSTLLKPNTRFYFYIDEVDSSDIIYPNLLKDLSITGTFLIGEKVDFYRKQNSSDISIQVIPNSRLSATVVSPYDFQDSNKIKTSDFSNGYISGGTVLAVNDLRSTDDSDINPTYPGTEFMIIGRTSGAVANSGNSSQHLYSDEFGNLSAFVILPGREFETGDLTFSISDIPDNLQVKNITGSYAIAQYYSQGTQLDVTSTVTTLEAPELTATAVTQSTTRFIPDPPPRPAGHDPIAQSFFIGEEGAFITSIQVYFLTKDETLPVTIDIRTVENGLPTQSIVPGSVSTVQSKDVKISSDASKPTTFEFDNPVYLTSNNSYVFVVRTTNKNYNMWVSRLGEVDVTTGLFIDKQPSVGVLYKSSNQSIWTPDQFEDVKFVINRAKFDTGTTYTAVLPNSPLQDQKLSTNPIKFVDGSSVVKVFQTNHGMNSTGNKVTLSNVATNKSNLKLVSQISGNQLNIPITDILDTSNFNPSNDGWNIINNSQVSTTNKGFLKIDNEIISYSGVSAGSFTNCVRGEFGTTAISHSSGSIVSCFQLNGIILNQLNTTHTISKVISMDEYEITVPYQANETIQTGGNEILATKNIQYESITPSINIFTPQNTVSETNLLTVSGTSIGNTKQSSFIIRPLLGIDNLIENELTEPKLIMSKPNIDNFQSGLSGSLKTYVNMSTLSDRVSPIIDITGSSHITVSNRINKELDSNGDLDLSSEITPSGGKHSAYIIKKVILENSSTSVKVLFDAIRTQNCDIKVFVKVKGNSSPGEFDDMNYELVPALSYPTSRNPKEYRAFDFEIKSLREFQEFSVKIIFIGNDQSNVPKVKNFRSLALAL